MMMHGLAKVKYSRFRSHDITNNVRAPDQRLLTDVPQDFGCYCTADKRKFINKFVQNKFHLHIRDKQQV